LIECIDEGGEHFLVVTPDGVPEPYFGFPFLPVATRSNGGGNSKGGYAQSTEEEYPVQFAMFVKRQGDIPLSCLQLQPTG